MTVFGRIGPRFVRSSEAFEADCRAAAARYDRFQQVFSEIRRRLAYSPEIGTETPVGSGRYLVKNPAAPEFGVPAILILYAFDSANLILLRLKAG